MDHGAMRRGGQPRSSIPAKRSAADAQEEAWVANEDRFVLKQAKKKAIIRARAGRADSIDLLAVTLRALDATRDGYDSDDDDGELPAVDPEGVFEGLDDIQLDELDKGIDTYLALEHSKSNRDFWNTMKVICKDRRRAAPGKLQTARGMSSVTPEIDRLLAPKTHEQLETLEKQVKAKLRSNDDIDVDYWENLLKSLSIYKAKARLRQVSKSVLGARLETLRQQQEQEASALRNEIRENLKTSSLAASEEQAPHAASPAVLDPEPLLRLTPEDKSLTSLEEDEFKQKLIQDRRRVLKLGYIPARHGTKTSGTDLALSSEPKRDDMSRVTSALYDREAARGFNDNEEAFNAEEDVSTGRPKWAETYRPRKPRYFNRVQMGYEWNKYNQTHYDHENLPPKVVQGYKFNIFYPDLVDTTKAPTFRIERENGRKRGESFAPAGAEDTCLIRFIAGPPYEDIAFRIVDKEWDYSAKRERGFRSSFDKHYTMSYAMTYNPQFDWWNQPVDNTHQLSIPQHCRSGSVHGSEHSLQQQECGSGFFAPAQVNDVYQSTQGVPNYWISDLPHLNEASMPFTSLPTQIMPENCTSQCISSASLPPAAFSKEILPIDQFLNNDLATFGCTSPTSFIDNQVLPLSDVPALEFENMSDEAAHGRRQWTDSPMPDEIDSLAGSGETDDSLENSDPCYAELLRQALMEKKDDHTMLLKDLYEWVRTHSSKAQDPSNKGWQNSVRHNLSMNAAFERVPPPNQEAGTKKTSYWRLTKHAVEHGISSTTRYRKDSKRKTQRNPNPAPIRVQAGAKGGQATRRSVRRQQMAASPLSNHSSSSEAARQRSLRRPHQLRQ
ncbi:hypothetical protein KCU96_g11373, partial [Aureobasidium melanogenum]